VKAAQPENGDEWLCPILLGCDFALGCPLSPLMGALYLHQLDERMAKLGLFYTRFMDVST